MMSTVWSFRSLPLTHSLTQFNQSITQSLKHSITSRLARHWATGHLYLTLVCLCLTVSVSVFGLCSSLSLSLSISLLCLSSLSLYSVCLLVSVCLPSIGLIFPYSIRLCGDQVDIGRL